MNALVESLHRLHEELWDPTVQLERLAPGAALDIDLSALNLHSVRESALGAFFDLRCGNVARARQSLRAVLANQYRQADRPWTGTFKVAAEQPDPPAVGATPWVHFDPNWRQFVGCILALCLVAFEDDLDEELVQGVSDAIELCVEGEPEGRIPVWYSNPNLLHAWLTGWCGRRTNDPDKVRAATDRARSIVERFDRYGDLDEYNSPTYDGVDLWALAMWTAVPPDEYFEREGSRLLHIVADRMSVLHHPLLRVTCGPFIRAYGLLPHHYVSLSALWLCAVGGGEEMVPPILDSRTDHVHDLYFAPVFEYLAQRVPIPLRRCDVTEVRVHEQAFGPVRAVSVVMPDACLGWESGREHDFARDQYVPLVAYVRDGANTTQCVGVSLGRDVSTISVEDVALGAAAVTVMASGPSPTITLVSSTPCRVEPHLLDFDRIRVAIHGGSIVERKEQRGWYRYEIVDVRAVTLSILDVSALAP